MNASVREILSSLERLKKMTNELKAEISERNKDWPDNKCQIIEDIQRVLPSSKVYIIGTRFTGLAFKESDCDIYIDYDGRSYSSEMSQEDQSKTLVDMIDILLDSDFQFVCILEDASVPLLTVTHIRTEIRCDISCKSGLAVENSTLIRQLLTSDYRVSWLLLTVKWWMKENGLWGTNKFTSYTTTWLVLFFLMCIEPCVLRSVIDMKRRCTRKLIGHWDCAFTPDESRNANRESRFKLLVDFFKFYWEMDFDKVVLCPLTARTIPREHFEMLTLPAAYQSYTIFKRMNPDKGLATEKALCLQDPLELSNNIAKDVNKKDLKKFQALCCESYNICEHIWR